MDKRKLIIIAGAFISLLVIVIIGVAIFSRGGTSGPTTPNTVDCTKDPSNPVCIIDCDRDPQNEACLVDQPVDTPANIIIWGVFDEASFFKSAIEEFNKKYPNVKITYVKKQYKDYESMVVDAIASEEAPDIFAIQNDWLPKHKAKISPLKSSLYGAEEFSNDFSKAAYDDLVSDNKVYALPMYMDNLALFYNSSIFSQNYIYDVPATWDELTTISKTLTKKVTGNPNEIEQAGIALGTTENVTRANDILTALMMQTNTTIISQDRRSFSFNQFRKDENGEPYYPGTNALEFYTSFATPTKSLYSWNGSFENNIAAFAKEKVAMIIGYEYFESLIEKENPRINFKIAPLPQIKTANEKFTLANYWAYTVPNASPNKDLAWEFLRSIFDSQTGQPLYDYLQASGRTSPLKNGRGSSKNVFSEQMDIARTVFKGTSDEYDQIFNEMINDVVKFNQTLQGSIDSAASKANEMLAKYK